MPRALFQYLTYLASRVILILSPVNWCFAAPKGAQYITSLNIMASCSRDYNWKTEIPPCSDPRLSPESGYSSKMRFFLRPQSNDHPPPYSLLIFKHFRVQNSRKTFIAIPSSQLGFTHFPPTRSRAAHFCVYLLDLTLGKSGRIAPGLVLRFLRIQSYMNLSISYNLIKLRPERRAFGGSSPSNAQWIPPYVLRRSLNLLDASRLGPPMSNSLSGGSRLTRDRDGRPGKSTCGIYDGRDRVEQTGAVDREWLRIDARTDWRE
ncbi:hypothetical protein C8R43DRAFT_954913 [Mycena crocata]|nr:hypothetical protein C8R43DRAFT_954913 [Mycena crocata]